MSLAVPEGVAYDERGLVPVVVQDRASGDVLMLAWADAEAVERSARTGLAHFFSRRRQALWRKGESSGNTLAVKALELDCDRDTLLMLVEPRGPTCHTGARTCFGEPAASDAGVLAEIARVVAERARTRPAGSYTVSLLEKGLDHVLKKVGEEATEVVLAAKGESPERLAEEAADLLFHLLVALSLRGLGPEAVLEALRSRRGPR